jgi:RNA polymerase sigma factor (sigma-70 family)
MTHALPADELARLERYARRVAFRRWRYREGRGIPLCGDLGDYLSATSYALARTLSRWDPAQGKAETFVGPALHGAVIDEERFWGGRKGEKRHLSLDRLISDEEQMDAFGDTFPDLEMDAAADALAPLLAEADAAEVRRLLRFVTDRERQVLALYYWGGLTQIQIAREMGISESRVYQHRTAGLRRLRDILAPAPEEEA